MGIVWAVLAGKVHAVTLLCTQHHIWHRQTLTHTHTHILAPPLSLSLFVPSLCLSRAVSRPPPLTQRPCLASCRGKLRQIRPAQGCGECQSLPQSPAHAGGGWGVGWREISERECVWRGGGNGEWEERDEKRGMRRVKSATPVISTQKQADTSETFMFSSRCFH